jgi:hypothetical protein
VLVGASVVGVLLVPLLWRAVRGEDRRSARALDEAPLASIEGRE